jgi:hypothetical protein
MSNVEALEWPAAPKGDAGPTECEGGVLDAWPSTTTASVGGNLFFARGSGGGEPCIGPYNGDTPARRGETGGGADEGK